MLSKLNIDDIYWRIKYGKASKKISPIELRSKLNECVKNPVFFLSTGRCGTKWFSDLLQTQKKLMLLHSPSPTLAVQSKKVYESIQAGLKADENKWITEVFLTGREEYLRYAFKTKKRIIETNNYITFFAPFLADLFPDAKFVHVYRHPGEFVRSGIRRNYYTEHNFDDIKRITPIDSAGLENWETYSRIEKTSWLWHETNAFIEVFKERNPQKCFTYNFNENSEKNLDALLNFLNIELNIKNTTSYFNKKSNAQKSGSFPKYENWETKDKTALKDICGNLATKYNFHL